MVEVDLEIQYGPVLTGVSAMIIDGRNVPAGSTVDVDLCIIGGGPTGISLALQYINKPGVTVALVESGGREWDDRTQELANA
ncbi:MAG: hypothetical protein U9N84_09320, partial [Actinomycetota bacterium]|nr:hypothetical protein [Actinomycetota bacterium]